MQAKLRRLKKIKALATDDWSILLASLLLLPAAALALRMKGYTWTRELLGTPAKKRQNRYMTKENQLDQAQRIARLVTAAANHGVYRANCLKKSLVTQYLLHHKGIATELKIGVHNDLDVFNAHAWLEYKGHVLIDSSDIKELFTAFESH